MAQQRPLAVECPVPTCRARIVRVDKHLQNVHKMKKDDPQYKRYNYETMVARAAARQEPPTAKRVMFEMHE